MQAAVRARIGEGVTAFARIEDGARSVAVGDVVKLAVRPALMGVVQHFIVHQACPLLWVIADRQCTMALLYRTCQGSARTLSMWAQEEKYNARMLVNVKCKGCSTWQAVREEGTYARGSVAVRPLPPEVYGTTAERVVPLRRLEGAAVEEEDVARHVARELEKARMLDFRVFFSGFKYVGLI